MPTRDCAMTAPTSRRATHLVLARDRPPSHDAPDRAAELLGRCAGNAVADLHVGHPAARRLEDVVDVAPRVLAVDVQRVRRLPGRAERFLVVDVEADAERGRASLVDRAPARGDRGGARDEVLDVRALHAGAVGVDPAGWRRRPHEAQVELLHLRFDAGARPHLQSLVVEVHVAVRRAHAILRIGGVAGAGLEAPGRRLDDRQGHRRVVGLRRIGIDRRLHAREVVGCDQSANVIVERLLAVEITRMHIRQSCARARACSASVPGCRCGRCEMRGPLSSVTDRSALYDGGSMRDSLLASLAAAYGLAASVPTASLLAEVQVCWRHVSPFGSSHSSRNLEMAARPSGESLAGPLTSIATLCTTVAFPVRHHELDAHRLRRSIDP